MFSVKIFLGYRKNISKKSCKIFEKYIDNSINIIYTVNRVSYLVISYLRRCY